MSLWPVAGFIREWNFVAHQNIFCRSWLLPACLPEKFSIEENKRDRKQLKGLSEGGNAFIYYGKGKTRKTGKKHSLLAFHLIGLRVVPVETREQHPSLRPSPRISLRSALSQAQHLGSVHRSASCNWLEVAREQVLPVVLRKRSWTRPDGQSPLICHCKLSV